MPLTETCLICGCTVFWVYGDRPCSGGYVHRIADSSDYHRYIKKGLHKPTLGLVDSENPDQAIYDERYR